MQARGDEEYWQCRDCGEMFTGIRPTGESKYGVNVGPRGLSRWSAPHDSVDVENLTAARANDPPRRARRVRRLPRRLAGGNRARRGGLGPGS